MAEMLSSSPDSASLFDALPDAYVCLENGFCYTFVNRAAEQLLGKDRADLLGKVLWEVYPELGGTPFEGCYRRAMDERVSVTFEEYYEPWQRWYEITATPYSDGGIIVRTLDITARKRTEEALQASEAKFRDLFDGAPVAYHELDRDGVIRRVNRAECALFRCEEGDLLGRPVWEFAAGADQAAGREAVRRELCGEEPQAPSERRFLRRDGSELWLEIHDVLVRNATGEITGVRSALLDISDRKRAEDGLRESEDQFRSITAQISDLIALTDIDGFITYASPASSELFRLAPDEMCGHHFTEYLDESAIPKAAAAFRDAVEKGEGTKVLELKMRRADGSLFIGELSGLNFRRAAQKATMVVIRDITDRKRAAAEIERANRTMRMALVTGKAGAWELNLETGDLLWTEEYRQLLNVDSSFVPTLEAFLTLVHPEDRDLVTADIRKSIDDRAPSFQNQFRIVLADGVHWMERSGTIQCDAAGRAERMIGITSDITARKRAEEDLQRLADIVESSDDAIIGKTSDGIITSWNPGAARIYGYTKDEALGRSIAMLIPPEHQEELTDILDRVRRGERVQHFEAERVRKDGVRVFVSLTVSPISDTSGRIVGASTIGRDVTPRKLADAALRESEGRFAAFMANLPAVAFLKDEAGRTLFANQYLQDLLSFKDWEGKATRSLIAGEVGQKMEEDDRKVFSQGTLKVQETVVDSRGDLRTFETIKFSIQLGGTTMLLGGISVDVTARMRAEEDLKKRNVFIETLLENAPIGFAVNTISEGRPVFFSRTFANVYGVEPDSIASVDDFFEKVFLEPGFREEIRQRIMTDMATGDPARMRWEDIAFTTRTGERRVVTATNIPLPEQDLMISTVQDVTASKALEAQFHQAQKMESVGRLAGGVAHDFNNLLTVINGYSQLVLRNLKPGDPLRGSLEEIHKAGKSAEALTRQLLAFSRKQVLEPRRLNVNRLVAEMRPMLERLVGEDIEVRVALHAECGTIHADPHQLEQVVMNLVVNARDAMPGIGKLLVETADTERDESYARSHLEARVGRYVMLAVSDTGVGMDEETKRRIFEPFFTTKPIGKGTGLGLAMVQGIVAQSGGYVEVYSEKGEGTTFKVYLPALAEAATAGFSASAAPVTGGNETVLVVEDQAEVLTYAVAVLKDYGYRVIPAGTAGEALLLCEQEHVNLLLTDVIMPNLSGRELADRLEKLQPGMKVLFMSGYTDDAIVQRGVLEHKAQFIQKPFSPEALAGKVRAILGCVGPMARIVVADDDAGVRTFLRKVLEDGGYEVIEAADGKQVLQQARAEHVDLVITDLVMPEQEGIETIQALRRDLPNVRIIAMSGAFGGQFLGIATQMGAAAVLNKPVGGDLLLAKVAEVLKTPRS